MSNCVICLDKLKNPRETSCNHKFCFKCIKSWIDSCQENELCEVCPLCRKEITILKKITELKRENIPRKYYRTRLTVSKENVTKILRDWNLCHYQHNVEGLWETAKDIRKKGKILFWHSKYMKECFNTKMTEFGEKYHSKFLGLLV